MPGQFGPDDRIADKHAMAAKSTPTYYIFHGKNSFERRHDVHLMKARMGKGAEAELNISEFREQPVAVANILNDATTFPFLNDKRLVIVYDLLSTLGRKGAGKEAKAELDTLVAALPTLPEYARLVFVENDELSASHPVLKLLDTDTHGYEKVFNLPRSMPEWIARRAVAYEAEIEPRAAALLAEMVNQDLFSADSELAKLADFVRADPAGAHPIRESDVRLMTENNVETKIWDLTDALGTRNGKLAAAIAHKVLDDGSEPLMILGSIYSHFRKLIIVKAFDAENSSGNLSDALNGAGSFVLGKLRDQARHFTYQELKDIHRLLLETDHGIKTGEFAGTAPANGVLAIDLLIATVTA